MKIALIGDGKTGQYVKEFINKEDLVGPFNQKFLIEDHIDLLKKADIGISFTTGPVMEKILPTLLETNVPMVIGSTGFNYPDNLHQILIDKKLTYIYASNFSLGVLVIKHLMETLRRVAPIIPNQELSIHEIHHTMKKDAPSGTALSIEKWLSPNQKLKITSSREGDVVGTHEITLSTLNETIKVSHEAKNRKIFAEGAYEAANYLNKNRENIPYGLISFDQIMKLKNGESL